MPVNTDWTQEALNSTEFWERLIKSSVAAELVQGQYGRRILHDIVQNAVRIHDDFTDAYCARDVKATENQQDPSDMAAIVRGMIHLFRRRFPLQGDMLVGTVDKALLEELPPLEEA